MEDMRIRLSVLWVFAVFNYLYADVIALFDLLGATDRKPGYAGSFHITQGFLLTVAVFMEIPIAMVILSRLLKYPVNRWANIITGGVETVAVLLLTFALPLLNRTSPPLYYAFFGAIEIVCTSLIAWYAWKWPKEEGLGPEAPGHANQHNPMQLGVTSR